ncbi:MAG TPA: peptide deformylase [Vicinamibacterales bacterium]|jgi:peptide deformylase|nr:peptide deformylase [Vicinamibacterales bacterium]
MSILKVARMGHPVLRRPARPLQPSELRSPEVQRLIEDMIDTMKEYHGIGLAAPQVHESLRIFVAGSSDAEAGLPLIVVVNPEITPIGSDTVEDWEGCLSIPDVRGKVPRARQIQLRGLDREGRRLDMKVAGYTARVMQHETDHLDGILFFDRMRSFETLSFLEEFGRYWSEQEVTPE